MKVGSVENTGATSLSKQSRQSTQSSVSNKTRRRVFRLRPAISPNANIRITKVRHQRLHVNCNATIGRRQWPKEYDSHGVVLKKQKYWTGVDPQAAVRSSALKICFCQTRTKA